MRPLKGFSAKDWLQLQPLIHQGKQLRNDLLLNSFLKARPGGLEKFLHNSSSLKGKTVLQIIAFEEPEVLNLSLKMARRHLIGATLLVFDNSLQDETRAKNERVCREHDAGYLALPGNPVRHPNRSHGLAMTWVWRNVTKAIQPATAGFIDHDLILLEKTDLAKVLRGQPFYGLPNAGKWGWSLWAGYCFYDLGTAGSLPLNFLYDFSRGLDTGGRNWDSLYRKHDARRLEFAHWEMFEMKDDDTGNWRQIEIIDRAWLHIAGVSYREQYRQHQSFYGRLAKAIEEGTGWPELQARMGGADKIRALSRETVLKNRRRRWQSIAFEEQAGISSRLSGSEENR